MKNIADFLIKEMPSHIKEIQNDFEHLYNRLDNTQSEIEEKLPLFKGNYAKIGEYYSMAQELDEIKKQLQKIQELFSIEKHSVKETSYEELSTKEIPVVDKNWYKEDLLNVNERINYNDYRVNDTVPYSLSEDFKHKRPAAFKFDGERYTVKDWKQMLLMVCEIMYNKDHSMFHEIVMGKDMQGKSRAYFSDEKCTYKPMVDGRKISGSNIYVETNHNANTICSIIKSLLIKYGIPVTELKIYLKADYTPLHQAKLDTEKKEVSIQVQVSNETNLKTGIKYNPDDFRFAKDSYIKKSDPAMEKLSQRMGTASHIEYLRMEEGDTRRHKSRCIKYNKEKDICMCTTSGNYLLKCGGSSHCKYYKEEIKIVSSDDNGKMRQKSIVKSKPKIKVIDKKKIKNCPSCKCTTKKEWLIVNYYNNGVYVQNKLSSYHCDECNSSYIADTLFRTYTKNKNIDNIDIEFIQE